jgi:hypothetical protein
VAPIIAAYRLQRDSWFSTAALAGIAMYSLYIYERDMFGPGARSTSALIFVWLPIYQWIVLGALLGISKLAGVGNNG